MLLSSPIKSQHVTKVMHSWFPTAIVSMQGHRLENEDCHVKFSHRSKSGVRIVHAIFDGHGGKGCARFYSTNLPNYLGKIHDPMKKSEISAVMRQMDQDFRKWAIEHKDTSGSTAIISIVERQKQKNGRVLTAYVGDSGALLIRTVLRPHKSENKMQIDQDQDQDRDQNQDRDRDNNFVIFALSHDHKPDLPEEKKRIEAAGHSVINVGGVERVDGELAMSRSLGDYKYKDNLSLPAHLQAVTCEPDFIETDLLDGDILALYCDGLVENQSRETLANSILNNLDNFQYSSISTALTKTARACIFASLRGASTDNHSIMLSVFVAVNDLVIKETKSQSTQSQTKWFPGAFTPRTDESNYIRRYFDDASKNGATNLENFIAACGGKVEDVVKNIELPKDRKSSGNDLVDRVLYILSVL